LKESATHVVIPKGAVCREESAVVGGMPATAKNRIPRFTIGMTTLQAIQIYAKNERKYIQPLYC